MRSEELRLDELVDFSEGSLRLHGRRLVLHDMHAFAQFRKDLVDMVGIEHARRMLTRFGYFWGQADAAAMKRVFKWDSLSEWLKAGPRLHTLQGVARTNIKRLDCDETTGAFHMELVWHDSGEAAEHMAELGRSEVPVCWMLAGYFSGYASFCLGKSVYFIESRCVAKGDRVCGATGKDAASWGDELKPHAAYFQSEDVKGKISRLSSQLKRRTRELTVQRERANALQSVAKSSFVEVKSESFRRVLDLAGRVATYDSSVLISGKSGVGKEVLARYIHGLSKRSNESFLGVNCGALPETLLESELFGHKAGAFTGAIHDRIGLFEKANKGTIFLDEIGDVSPAVQLKLLRVLQEREIMRVGESKTRKVDVRVLAATNRDLAHEIKQGRFREDLYYRLAVIEIEVPPLVERKEDIISLARYLVKRLSKKLKMPGLRLGATSFDYLLNYAWPGNVRELENALERAALLCKGGEILPEYLPRSVIEAGITGASAGKALGHTLAEVERSHIEAVLRHAGGNRTRTAKILGISPATLWRKLKAWDNDVPT